MKSIAIIPARGGSKRIPHKNIKEFCGRPMLSYSVEAAVQSGIFDTVMVSTDDEEIAEIARRYGAEVPFMRSERTAGDYAQIPDVVMEVLDEYEKRGVHYEIGGLIFSTAVFLSGQRLREASEMLKNSDAESVVPVVRFSYPPQRAMVIRDGRLVFEYPQYLDSRSQDLEPHYHDAAQFILFHTDAFRRNKRLLTGDILPYVIDEMEVQDIDTETDWQIAEMKYRLMRKKRGE